MTKQGQVLGTTDGHVNTFLGIPYAEPPIGRLRFRPPQPKPPWYPQTYTTLSSAPECLQSELIAGPPDEEAGEERSEDCLYLNIWTPATTQVELQHRRRTSTSTKRGSSSSSSSGRLPPLLPVMVWFYGGAFIHGGSSRAEYNGYFLARRGEVVVVTFNYRVGALGFLVSISDGLYGNYGLADQKMVLQWVQDHIEAFGGDPSRVTLFGESAAVANFIGSSFKEQLDCEDLRCLQAESAEELIHVQDTLMAVPRSIGDFFAWGPVVTDASYYREVRLRPGPLANMTVYQPIAATLSLHQLDIPVLLGSNHDEGTIFVFSAYPTRMNKLIFMTLMISMFRTAAMAVLRTYDELIRWSRNNVFLYEFRLPTRTPGFDFCEGLSCHTYYWITFARHGDVNEVIHYERKSRPSDAILWPRLFGEELAIDRPACPLSKQRPATSTSSSSSPSYPRFDDDDYDEEEEEEEQDREEQETTISRSVHRHMDEDGNPHMHDDQGHAYLLRKFIFDRDSHVQQMDSDNDCICLFWNSLGYRF
eukprot:gene10261-11356_t